MNTRTGPRRGPVALAALTSLALLTAVSVGIARAATTDPAAPAGAAGSADPGAPGPERVATLTYTLGDSAFHVPAFHVDPTDTDLAPIELTGVVHYPRDLSGGPHPLVLLLHGLAETCADRTAPPFSHELNQWPCAPGTPPIPSYRGYDYLGENLASYGFVAVSISANGVNVGDQGMQDPARATLINKHLAMWQQLTGTGGGPLAGRFTDPDTGATRTVDFTGKIDMTRVGTFGHSRGGRGVMYQAADSHRADWPVGVQIRAVFPMAPAGIAVPEDPDLAAEVLTTTVPFAEWDGTCDYAVTGNFFEVNGAKDRAGSRRLLVHGANHNFINTQWSPSSGQVGASDDADLGPRPGPGLCTERVGDAPVRQLTEAEERTVATGYVSAFFRRYLTGDTAMDPILDGASQPYAALTTVDIDRHAPA
jgi:hypothetical protein